MGVDFFSCNNCGETFPDCGDFVRCDCRNKWCSIKCAEEDGYRIDKEETDEYEQMTSCKYCREEDYEDWKLLNFALELLKLNRDQLIQKYKNKNGV